MSGTDREKTGAGETTRRSFIGKLWLVLGLVALAEFIGIGIAFVRPRKGRVAKGKYGTVIVAGPVERFEPGSVTAFPRGKFYLARLEDGGFLALSRECTHLGCTVPWDPDASKFICPCHASSFDIRGEVVSPPAPRALHMHPVSIENNMVKVNTGKTVRRRRFVPGQVAMPY